MDKGQLRGNLSKIDPKTRVEPYYLTNTLTQYDKPREDGENGTSVLDDEHVELAKAEVDLNHK